MPGFVEERRAVGVLPAGDQPLFGEEIALGALRKLSFVLTQVFFSSRACYLLLRQVEGSMGRALSQAQGRRLSSVACLYSTAPDQTR